MSIKDALTGFLFWVWILLFALYVITTTNVALWILMVISVLAWICYVIIAIRDHQRDIKYPLLRYREAPQDPRAKPQPVYDQEEETDDLSGSDDKGR